MGAGRRATSPEEGTISVSSELKSRCSWESAERKLQVLPSLFPAPVNSSLSVSTLPWGLAEPDRGPANAGVSARGCSSGAAGGAVSWPAAPPHRTPAIPGTHGGGMPGNPVPTLRRQHLARVSPWTQALSDRYLSAAGPREAENHTHTMGFREPWVLKQESKADHRNQLCTWKTAPFPKDVPSLSPSGHPTRRQ